jgi:NNP family nitrate/nitrite transporter-like MFS transporter
MSSQAQLNHPRGKEWLTNWDPENSETWDSRLAWRTLGITTFALTMAFSTWFLASAFAPILTNLGFDLSKGQLYWLAAMPGLAGGSLRLLWMFLPPVMGTRRLVTVTTALLLLPLVGWFFAIQDNQTPYWVLMALAFLAGIGGGAFSGFMPSTSYFFPRRLQGTALGLQAGIGNFGVSLVQFVTPIVVGVGLIGASQIFTDPAKGTTKEVWYQNAALVYIPLVVIAAVLAWTMLKSVPVTANFRQQLDIFGNQDTWWMTYLYVMTFGTFAGLSAQFGLLMKNLYGAGNTAIVETLADGSTQLLIEGYEVPNPVAYVWLGPLIGAGARVVFSPLTDRMGGAIWTLISGIGLIASIAFTITTLSPDPAAGAEALKSDFTLFLWGMLAIFLFAGIGNASTFKQMPMIFERRQAGGVIGWTAAIAAFGPFFFGAILAASNPRLFFILGLVYAVGGVLIAWVRYARPGAPKPG